MFAQKGTNGKRVLIVYVCIDNYLVRWFIEKDKAFKYLSLRMRGFVFKSHYPK
ncbi:hypothetical protein Hdeb2414_s0016g00471201 [Helianthus debilis subsp. tardiflorus]